MYIGKLVNPARIKWNNIRIQKAWTLKYLGVVIDNNLSWVPHIVDRGTKSLDHYHQLQRIAGKNWGLSTANRKLIYKTSLPHNLNIELKNTNRHSSSSPHKSIKISRLRQSAYVIDDPIDPTSYEEILRGHQFHPAEFKIDNQISTEPALNYPTENATFTDGSKTTEGTGSAFCCFDETGQLKSEWMGKLTLDNNIFQAELFAISQAILHHTNSNAQIKIWTDSLSSLQAILNPTSPHDLVRNIQNQLQSKDNIDLGWIKAHIGHYGNETADALAKKAINEGITSKIKKATYLSQKIS
ncbi:hypothetical protein AVEN_110409-1 [Araneus ventricosus]|uniref:RNase H type-1 domain-containing protein n=1 Tax=Araneus ventricosus TaxID=182803 RepID=A0A4Y2P6T7_ARAVE|nr:hypothetical protein AVEN_110409-1 [Araneus ventricosus]